jgi:hypothetical protein
VRRPDLDGGPALELAVVELPQSLVKLDPVAEAGEGACLDRTPRRTREHVVERPTDEQLADRDGLETTLLGERDVGAPGVLSRERPLGLAMPDQPDRHGEGA